jgi:hypothetical protein
VNPNPFTTKLNPMEVNSGILKEEDVKFYRVHGRMKR